jgi:hypothetical protein
MHVHTPTATLVANIRITSSSNAIPAARAAIGTRL